MATQLKLSRYSEADLILDLGLERVKSPYSKELEDLLNADTLLSAREQELIDKVLFRVDKESKHWNTRDRKMKFLSPVLELSNLIDGGNFQTYFEKTIMEIACRKRKKSFPRITPMNTNKNRLSNYSATIFMRKETIRGDSFYSRAENLIFGCRQ
jgi:hypothetical protein